MDFSFLNLLIIGIVLSFVASLILLIISPKLPLYAAHIVITIHVLLAIGMLTKIIVMKQQTTPTLALWFSIFICTGIIGFALTIRKKINGMIKAYFSIFILSFPVFLIAPSRMFTIMSLGLLSIENANEVALKDNHFLVREQGMLKHDDANATYKVVKRMGMFNKTIARNIYLGFSPDSARLLFLNEKTELRLRAFGKTMSGIDSLDVHANTIASRDTILKIIKHQ
jgi:hypothetical protein